MKNSDESALPLLLIYFQCVKGDVYTYIYIYIYISIHIFLCEFGPKSVKMICLSNVKTLRIPDEG